MINSDKVRSLLYDMLWHPASSVEEHHLPLPNGVNYCWRKNFPLLTCDEISWIVQKNTKWHKMFIKCIKYKQKNYAIFL